MSFNLLLRAAFPVVFSLPAAAAPMPRLGAGTSGLAVCRQEPLYPGMPCPAPDATGSLIEPHALWGGDIEASGCSAADRTLLLSHLESEAALFNGGVLRSRQGVGLQLFAQTTALGEGGGCREASAEWQRYIAVQRELFTARMENGVRAGLAQCPRGEGAAGAASRPAKRKGGVARNAALCREGPAVDARRARGACDAVPEVDRQRGTLVDDVTHAGMRVCSTDAANRTRVIVAARTANFIASLALQNLAGAAFLAAQEGVSCDETVAAYEAHAQNQTRIFSSVWLAATGKTAEACRSAVAQ